MSTAEKLDLKLQLRNLGQVVGCDEGISGLFQGGEEVKCFRQSELNSGRRFPISRFVHGPKLLRGCVESRWDIVPGQKGYLTD